ncbi:hypothetical protein BGZ80_003447 [Entomortierella chlamydospora]|uniref:Uncharacterized protein n=1 Tax=Entomortierella chlamydospora TaxID=101097 RepID=A0A9P6N269_9FUNG|nr:hypothetical protein BGZ79_004651 [Entomortierella chlamydospora]KAG0020875.1 hypothetical protein BGZ80_003447 [Entomortierella chlamydospora]
MKLDFMDAKDDLESTQANLDAALSNLEEKDLELKNSELALANSEYTRQVTKAELDKERSSHAETKLELQNIKGALVNTERTLQEANQNRVLPRPPKDQEIFIVLKFNNLQPSPVGGFRIFAQQRKVIDGRIKQFITDNPELDAVEVKELRFDPSPREENVIQHMRRDKDAPIKLTNRSFVLRGEKNTEPEMIAYIREVFHTYTKDSPASTADPAAAAAAVNPPAAAADPAASPESG